MATMKAKSFEGEEAKEHKIRITLTSQKVAALEKGACRVLGGVRCVEGGGEGAAVGARCVPHPLSPVRVRVVC